MTATAAAAARPAPAEHPPRGPLERLGLPLALAGAALAAVVYAAGALFRHGRYGTHAHDLGIFDQTIWGYSRFEIVANDVVPIPNLLGDHFHPILFALAPLYWLWEDVRVLLIVQALLLAVASVPVFLLARERLGVVAALLVQGALLGYWGLIRGMLFDFHEIAFAVPALAWGLYGLLTGRMRLFWAMLVLGLLTKENVAIAFAFVGIFILVAQRRWKLGAAVIGVCLAWFVLATSVLMPLASGGAAFRHWSYDALGPDLPSAIGHLIAHPIDSLRLFLTPAPKAETLLLLFLPWLLLPLLSPVTIVALPLLAERFFAGRSALWGTEFHYSMTIGPVLAIATVDALSRLRGRLGPRIGWAVTLAAAAGVIGASALVSVGPANARGDLPEQLAPERAAAIDRCLAVIPDEAPVAASQALAPHLTHRRDLELLPDGVGSFEYLALDPIASAFPATQRELAALVTRALDGGYGVACSDGTALVLRRGAPRGELSPEMAAFVRAPCDPRFVSLRNPCGG